MYKISLCVLFLCMLNVAGTCLFAADEAAVPEWKLALVQKLELQADFDYQDMQLDEVADILSSVLKISIIIDTPALKENPPVSFKSKPNQSALESLRQILKQLGMEHQIRDEAIFIYRQGAYHPEEEASNAPLNAAELTKLAKEIENLGADSFAVRELASLAILKMGSPARPALATAAKSTSDAEALNRLRGLLEQFSTHANFGENAEVAAFLNALDGAPLTMEFVESPADEALPYVATLLKLSVSYDADALSKKPVTLKLKEMKAANALRWMTRLSGSAFTIEQKHLHVTKTK